MVWLALTIAAFYGSMATIVGVNAYFLHNHRSPKTTGYELDAEAFGVLTGVFWPIGVWLVLGFGIIELIEGLIRRRRQQQVEQKQQVEHDRKEREMLLEMARKELDNS